ncbi:venom allergen 5-like [Agrilus planipennis]|uniref:Venom allergen 5-like n=1 Tax=Agrilus planipennis TaxID=224129 RepID=A0A1W4WQ69_AGRPL|nr:venom allergen 5-like [Agrilus planipennis]
MTWRLILLIFCLFFSIECSQYCQKQYQCGNDIHTMCKRGQCGPSSACGENFVALGMNKQTRKFVLELHNGIRNRIALGKIKEGNNGEAANMHELVYDNELEKIAQCWANYCEKDGFRHPHDSCRKTKQFNYVGQNLYLIKMHFGNFTSTRFIEQSINGWYSEIKYMDKTIIDRFHGSERGNVGHFTQMIWAETTHIGCGRTQYGKGKNFYFLFICNYGIGGNVAGDAVYTRGKPCSQCGKIGCSSRYKGLCATKDLSIIGSRTVIKSVWVNLIVLIAIICNYLKAFLKYVLNKL